MKKLIFLLLISSSVHGQTARLDTLTAFTSHSGFPITVGRGSFVINSPYNCKRYYKDTVSIRLLVCDTSLYAGYTTTVFFLNPVMRAAQEHHSVNWINGYLVRNVTMSPKGSHQEGDYMWYNQKDEYNYSVGQYLDDRKVPLPKYILVWMAQ